MATLYWNEKGEIACEKHTPYKGSDTWSNERWKEMTGIDKVMFYDHMKKTLPDNLASFPACECCNQYQAASVDPFCK